MIGRRSFTVAGPTLWKSSCCCGVFVILASDTQLQPYLLTYSAIAEPLLSAMLDEAGIVLVASVLSVCPCKS